jgi:inorganic pyrophosphatase
MKIALNVPTPCREKTMPRLTRLDTFDPETGELNVIIETPKGSRNKLKYEENNRLFALSKVLPLGAVFPFDFGFIPSTRGEDGDPVDVLILLDEPVAPGCRVSARLVGVIEADQTENNRTVRNDRLIAVAAKSHTHRTIRSLKELSEESLQEMTHFFISYDEMSGKTFKPLKQRGPEQAEAMVKQGEQREKERRADCRGGKKAKKAVRSRKG